MSEQAWLKELRKEFGEVVGEAVPNKTHALSEKQPATMLLEKDTAMAMFSKIDQFHAKNPEQMHGFPDLKSNMVDMGYQVKLTLPTGISEDVFKQDIMSGEINPDRLITAQHIKITDDINKRRNKADMVKMSTNQSPHDHAMEFTSYNLLSLTQLTTENGMTYRMVADEGHLSIKGKNNDSDIQIRMIKDNHDPMSSHVEISGFIDPQSSSSVKKDIVSSLKKAGFNDFNLSTQANGMINKITPSIDMGKEPMFGNQGFFTHKKEVLAADEHAHNTVKNILSAIVIESMEENESVNSALKRARLRQNPSSSERSELNKMMRTTKIKPRASSAQL